MAASEENWYIIKQGTDEQCTILSEQDLSDLGQSSEAQSNELSLEKWGPFNSKNQAIAKRVGLIRAGKCQPR